MKVLAFLFACLLSTVAMAAPLKYKIDGVTGKVKLLIDMDQVTSDVDIIFVVDNSASMTPHQQTVMQNAQIFIDGLSKGGTNWKIGLISTTSTGEVPYIGMAAGDELTSTSPNAVGRFMAAVGRLGTDGEAFERPFESVTNALAAYPNFLRPGADLVIILISDASEQSPQTPDAFLANLQFLKGDLNKVSFFGFLSPIEWCAPTDDAYQWLGSKYEVLLTKIKGSASPICDPQMGAKIAVLGESLSKSAENPVRNTIHEIQLPSIPDFKTISVNYGTQVINPGSISTGWIYDDAKNQVLLGDKIPWSIQPAKTPLEVTYVPLDWVK